MFVVRGSAVQGGEAHGVQEASVTGKRWPSAALGSAAMGPGSLGKEAHAVEADDDGGSFVAGDAER